MALTQKLTNMSTHNQNTPETCSFDSNQDPKKSDSTYIKLEPYYKEKLIETKAIKIENETPIPSVAQLFLARLQLLIFLYLKRE
ncbi:MAG: hypothetical protein WA667_12615 [Candidatus Nitrosopolaris sp.]